jgi:hypothetical protein
MADKKISQLTGAATPLAGTEVLPIVQSGSTVKVSVDNLTAGKTVSASSINTTGDSGFGTSSPSYRVHAVSNANAAATVGVSNSTAGTTSAARFLAISDAGSAWLGMTSSSFTDITNAADAALLNANNASGGFAIAFDGTVQAKLTAAGNLQFFTSGNGINDTNNNELIKFTTTASAVNEFTITNAASGSSPTFSATGSGADIDVQLLPKGTGDVRALNKLRITSSAGDTNARLATKLTSVSTSATVISPIGNTWGNLCIVTGLDPGGAFFTDLVFTSATAGATVLSAKTVSGSPVARTYTMSGSDILQVAMASGTYNIHCAVFSGLN